MPHNMRLPAERAVPFAAKGLLHDNAEDQSPQPGLKVFLGLEGGDRFVFQPQIELAGALRPAQVSNPHLTKSQLKLIDSAELKLDLLLAPAPQSFCDMLANRLLDAVQIEPVLTFDDMKFGDVKTENAQMQYALGGSLGIHVHGQFGDAGQKCAAKFLEVIQ